MLFRIIGLFNCKQAEGQVYSLKSMLPDPDTGQDKTSSTKRRPEYSLCGKKWISSPNEIAAAFESF